MSRKKIIKYLQVPIYGAHVWVVVDDTLNDAIPRIQRAIPDLKIPDDNDDPEGSCLWSDCRFVIFIARRAIVRGSAVNTVAHEIHHLTSQIMHWIGHTPVGGYDEPTAYLCGWLTQKVYSVIKG
jgi:hypothetical protein